MVYFERAEMGDTGRVGSSMRDMNEAAPRTGGLRILGQIEKLSELLSRNDKALAVLSERLGPFLEPSTPEAPYDKNAAADRRPAESESQVARLLDELTERVAHQGAVILHLSERI